MSINQLRQARARVPFEPFNLHLANGDILQCLHPETMSFPVNQAVATFSLWMGPRWYLVDAAQVTMISPVEK